MDQLKEMKQDEDVKRGTASSSRDSPSEEARGDDVVPYRRINFKSLQCRDDSGDENQPHEPKVVQLNLKSSLMGVHISDDDEQLFFSRQSSMSSMISDKCRTSGYVPFKWEAEPGKAIEQPKAKVNMPLMPPPGSRNHSGLLHPQHSSGNDRGDHPQSSGTLIQSSAGSSKLPSGLLYPCSNPDGNSNSCLLNAAHFTFDSYVLAPDLGGVSGGNNFTERMFKKLVGESRMHQSKSKNGNSSSSHCQHGMHERESPVSTLDCPQSPTSSERSFRGKSKRKSLRCRSEDANIIATPLPKSQLAQYLMSTTAMSGDVVADDGDLEGPSEDAWHEPSPYHPELIDSYSSSALGKKKPTHEHWSSNSNSWNLSLVQNPLRTVSTIVSRRHQQKGSRLSKDAITPISLTGSYDGSSSARSRTIRKSMQSELNSGRSWFGSGRRSSMWACSGRLQMEVAAEPDLFEPDMEHANNVKNQRHQERANNVTNEQHQAKFDEEENFPFNNPIASSFVFQEADKSQNSSDADRNTTPKAIPSVIDSESEDLQFSDNFHDPEDGSITDSETSQTFSLDSEGPNGLLDQPPQWIPTRKIDYVREVVDSIGLSNRALSGLSGRALSGFLEIGRSGRFSADLQRGVILDKAQHPRTPDVRLKIFKSEKSSKRSILSPCLPFLHKSHKHVPRIQQAPGAVPSRRLQPVNSFTARLGPVAENSTLAGQFPLQ